MIFPRCLLNLLCFAAPTMHEERLARIPDEYKPRLHRALDALDETLSFTSKQGFGKSPVQMMVALIKLKEVQTALNSVANVHEPNVSEFVQQIDARADRVNQKILVFLLEFSEIAPKQYKKTVEVVRKKIEKYKKNSKESLVRERLIKRKIFSAPRITKSTTQFGIEARQVSEELEWNGLMQDLYSEWATTLQDRVATRTSEVRATETRTGRFCLRRKH